MDVVLVGLPGSGKSVVGKRLAHRHGAAFIDLDERIEREDGRPIPRIFEEDGEAAFRAMERRAVADLGPADPDPSRAPHRRDRWRRGRRSAQPLGAVPRIGRASGSIAGRRSSPSGCGGHRTSVRWSPGRDPIGTLRDLAARRERFYAAAGRAT